MQQINKTGSIHDVTKERIEREARTQSEDAPNGKWVTLTPKIVVKKPLDIDQMKETKIDKEPEEVEKHSVHSEEKEMEAGELMNSVRNEVEKQLNELRQELLFLKREKVKEEQRRMMAEAGVPKVRLLYTSSGNYFLTFCLFLYL